ncbi:MAG: hypothetical protein LUF04_06950 [Bacteroides sp.]|nr:hypothetical protein [Bacteroides sp.]
MFSSSADIGKIQIRGIINEVQKLVDYVNGVEGVEMPDFINEDQIKLIKENKVIISEIIKELEKKQSGGDTFDNNPVVKFIRALKELKKTYKDVQEGTKDAEDLQNAQNNVVEKFVGLTFAAAGQVNFLGDSLKKLGEASGSVSLVNLGAQFSAWGKMMEGTLTGLAKGDFLGAALSGITRIFHQTLDAMAMVKASQKEAKQNARDFARAMELLSLKRLVSDENESVFGVKSIKRAIDNSRSAREALKAYNEKFNKRTEPTKKKESNSLGVGIYGIPAIGLSIWGFSKSETNEYKTLKKAYEKGYTDLQAMAVKTTSRSGFAKFWGKKDKYTSLYDRAPGMWNDKGEFDVEAAKLFLQTNTQITDEQRKQIQNAIDLQEQYEEAMEAIRNEIKETFGFLGNDLTNSIVEAIKTGADAWDIFKDSGIKALEQLGEKLIYELYLAKKFADLQDELEETYKIENSEQAAKAQKEIIYSFMDGIGPTIDEAMRFANEWKEEAKKRGYNLWESEDEAYSQQATSKGFQTMSQDTASELEGRFTALQIAGNDIRELNIKQNEHIESMGHNIDSIRFYTLGISVDLSEMKDISFRSLDNLILIEKHTRNLHSMKEDLGRIRTHLQSL